MTSPSCFMARMMPGVALSVRDPREASELVASRRWWHIVDLRYLVLCMLCSCTAASADPIRLDVRIAVPGKDGAPFRAVGTLEQEVPIDVVGDPVVLTCEARQTLFTGMWGVVWTMTESDRARVERAREVWGEAGLVYDSRLVAWWYDGKIPNRGELSWPTLTEEAARSLAVRISAR